MSDIRVYSAKHFHIFKLRHLQVIENNESSINFIPVISDGCVLTPLGFSINSFKNLSYLLYLRLYHPHAMPDQLKLPFVKITMTGSNVGCSCLEVFKAVVLGRLSLFTKPRLAL